MRDNQELFDRGDNEDVETWTLKEELPYNTQRDIFAGIKALDSDILMKANSSLMQLHRLLRFIKISKSPFMMQLHRTPYL